MSSVIVSHVPASVTAAKVEEFFAFCGSIKQVNALGSADSPKFNSFQIVFSSEKALDTALLLNDAELDGESITVSEEKLPEYDSSTKPIGDLDNKVQSDVTKTGDSSYDDIIQEEKPKLAILAQLLASGYQLSDDLIDRAIKIDNKKGISAKFKSFLTDLDSKYLHTQDPTSATSKNLNKAQDQLSSLSESFKPYLQRLNHYFEKATASPYGAKVHQFYNQVAKEAQDVHAEATRLYNLKKAENVPATSAVTEDAATTTATATK